MPRPSIPVKIERLVSIAVALVLLPAIAVEEDAQNATISSSQSDLLAFLESKSSFDTYSFPPCGPAGKELTMQELYDLYEDLGRQKASIFETNVEVVISYLTGIDEKNQQVTMAILLEASWKDCRVDWDIQQYPVDELFLFTKTLHKDQTVFIPPIVLVEQIEPKFDLSENSYLWIRPGELNLRKLYSAKFFCNLDVTLFPFDTQVCLMTVASVDTFLRYINITEKPCTGTCNPLKRHVSDQVVMDTWEVSAGEPQWYRQNIKPCTPAELANPAIDHDEFCYAAKLVHRIILRRHPNFQFVNLFFPVLISVFLSSFVFLLPPGKGDKMGLSLTILLSLFVYTQTVYTSLPDTGRNLPLISAYVMVCIYLVGFSCVISLLGDMLEAKAMFMPNFVRQLMLIYIGPIILPRLFTERQRLREQRQGVSAVQSNEEQYYQQQQQQKQQEKHANSSESSSIRAAENGDDWRLIAAVFDRCFFYVHLTVTISVFLIFMIYGYVNWVGFAGKNAT